MNNIFDAIPENIDTEIFELLAKSNGTRIERIISKGHKSPDSGWYDQETNEWVLVLRGEAILLFEDETSVNLKAGDYINIPAHKKHKVEWTDPEIETVWLAVHY
ncbi:MAG: cupin domain-containing protein [Gammaproteobacteria bacterium]|nr:cupin domain-containing protein [Gammaproteobacteria bacterium]